MNAMREFFPFYSQQVRILLYCMNPFQAFYALVGFKNLRLIISYLS